MTELEHLLAVERAAREWARAMRGCWPSTNYKQPSEPHEGTATMRDVKRAELALLAAVERKR